MAYRFNPLTGNLDMVREDTDLSYDPDTRTLSSSTGSDVVLSKATTTSAGLMSSEDKVKVDISASVGLAAGLAIALG